jgi:NADH:ubiquinone oxidoreductase subunit F (NADH-binding)/NADH:ubiquinone oxidoreductase subunit E
MTAPTIPLVEQPLRPLGRARATLKGRQSDEAALREVRVLIGAPPEGGHRRDLLIEHLHRLNDGFHGLFERHLVALAAEMRLPMVEVFEVASFYHHFEILKDGATAPALTVRVCVGLSCEMAGARELLARLPALLGADVRVVEAPCIGRCEQAPAVLAGQQAVPHATPAAVVAAVKALGDPDVLPGTSEGLSTEKIEKISHDPSAEWSFLPRRRRLQPGRGRGQRRARPRIGDPGAGDAGLRGLGGAGFPAGRKWRIVREQPAPRLMAVNIDEGEPGTFKDRTYLERDPHRFLEGVLIAAQVVGTEAVYIYLRDEYHGCRAPAAARAGALQADPPCPLPHIELRRGAGAYICGEESAMIESIEGKRGEPRMRPPYIAQVGLFGRPTLEHNFETLYWVRDIVEKGPTGLPSRPPRPQGPAQLQRERARQAARRQAGAGRHHAAELIDEYCGGMAEGHELYAYLPGGASGGILPASLADVPLDFRHPAALWLLHRLGRRHRAQPARPRARRRAERDAFLCGRELRPVHALPRGHGQGGALMEAPEWDSATLDDLAQVMADASICGLGQAAPNPIRCVHKYFRHEVGEAPWPGDLPKPKGKGAAAPGRATARPERAP